MYAKKNADKRVDIKSMNNLGHLNFDRTIFLFEGRAGDSKKKFIVKTILMIGDSQQFLASQEAILRKTFSSSLYYFKPEFYDFKDNYLHIGMKVQPLSLQSLIWIHKKEGKVFSTALVRDFTVRIFQGIARLKSSQIFPQNLKPSNIFLEIRSLEDKNWVWSQAGLHTSKRCQPYYKLNLQNIGKNASIKIDPYQMQFYSLAVMLLEMITFQSPQSIDKSIRSTGTINNINNFADAEDYYSGRLIQIIKLLIQPPKDGSLNKAIQQYKQSQQEQQNQDPDYQAYQFTEERLQNVFRSNLIQKVIEDCRSHIRSQNLNGRDVFDKLSLLDPQFNFAFNGLTELQQLIDFLGAKINDHELLYLATFLTTMSAIRYFKLLQSIFPQKQLIECIIAKASENYDSFKDFFQSQTGNKDFWKIEQIKLFLESLQTPFQQKDIVDTVKQWTKGNSKTSIKYSQIYAIFKPIIGMSMSLSSLKKPANITTGGQDGLNDAPKLLRIIMGKLKAKIQEQKGEDLVSFFRKHDLKENWTVDSKIYKIIKNYTKQKSLDDQKYRKAFIQMQKEGSIQGDMTKQINYIFLIRNLELEEPLTLLRQVITQKINESSREQFFQRYSKDKGWTFQSLIEFNKDQLLEFEDRQLRSLFSQMDSDRSGVIQTKELFYKLTNVKQFDYEYIIQHIKEKISREGSNLFKYFKECDPKARLLLNSPQELKQILDYLGITISEDHLEQLYAKFAKKGRFDYFTFLREFYTNYELFLLAVRFIVEEHYKGSFDKLYQMGLKQGKKKWNMDSISLLNEELILGLRDAQIRDIWSQFDPNKEGSLTKQEVAQIFRYDFERTTELTTKNVQSIKDLPKRKQQERKKEVNQSKKPIQQGHHQQKKQDRLYQQLKDIGDKNLLAICTKLLQLSPQKNGLISIQDCLSAFKDKNTRIDSDQFKKIVSTFKQSDSKRAKINFINLFFYICDHIYENQEQLAIKLKATLVVGIIKQVKRLKEISNSKIFQWCKRKNVMRLSDFQEVIRKLVEVEVYYSDLQPIWIHWGQPQYLTQQDFDNILQTKEYKEKVERQKNGRQKDISLEKKGSNRVKMKLADDNKMKDFVNQDSGSDTPQLRKPMSFGEKQTAFKRQNSRKNSIRESDDKRNAHQQTPISKFKQQSKNRQKQSRFNRERQRQRDIKQSNDDKKKSPFPNKKLKQQKIQLQQYVKPNKQIAKKEDKQKIVYNKNELLDKFRSEVADHGQQRVNELFSKANVIQSKRFISCLTINYNFSEEQAAQLADILARFDKIKLDTIKEQLAQKSLQPKQSPNKNKQRQQRNKIVQKNNLSPKKGNDNDGQKKIFDPRRQKVNIPLVKQQIKQLKNQFCKRFEIHEMQAFFFAQRDTLSRNDFIGKCQSVSTNFSTNICEKIFDFLRPDGQDRITVLTFKLGFNIDEPMEEQQEDYLPEQLEKQLKLVFQKADKDHSGFIQSDQVEQLLSSLGFNENLKEIQNYFAKMDQNFDNKISYHQFRLFIEDQILPQISSFDQDQEQLQQILRNNDIFRSGTLPITTFQAVIERYGVKLSQVQVQLLMRALNPEGLEINIRKALQAVRQPTFYEGKVRGVLYKIRLRKKVQLRQIQKIFENISSCFVMAYIPTVMEKEILNISTPYRPVLHQSGLFYCDLALRDARKTGMSQEGLIAGEIGNNDILVEFSLKQINGVPIPQKPQIKNNIVRRYLNMSFFDLSAETLKYSIWQVDCEWDPEVEDVWRFGNAYRSVFVKVAGYEPRKFEKIVILVQLVIAVVDNNRALEINCGSTTIPLRDLIIPDGKTTKKLKLIAGLPNRSKDLDKNSITKRTGWKNFFGGQAQSEMQVDLIHPNKFKEYHKTIASLPAQIIVGRKALPYMWIYRQVMAQSSFDGNTLNTHLASDLKILTFRLSLDVPQAFSKVWLWWKDKVQSRVKTLQQLKKIFKILMQDLHLILNAKQFELIKRCPSKTFIHNKTLIASRNKMVNEVLDNIQNWITSDLSGSYKRRKAYNYNYGPLQLYEADLPKEHRAFIENIARLIVK